MYFGLARVAGKTNVDNNWVSGPLWAAPEFWPFGSPVTKESDIFLYGMVIIKVRDDQMVICKPTHPLHEVFTGEVPFGTNEWEIKSKVQKGERPRWPNHSDFTESLWVLTQRCWSHKPQDRLNIQEVIGVLKEL